MLFHKQPSIQTHTGKMFRPFADEWYDIDIRDIAHSLSNLCRFNGHCKQFYSVAQHSVLVSNLLGDSKEYCDGQCKLLAQWGLLHDAPEAYMGDIATPIKSGEHLFLELRMLEAIGQKFGLRKLLLVEKNLVSEADKQLLVTEKRDLMEVNLLWPELTGIKGMGYTIEPLPPREAEDLFLQCYYELFGE